MTTVPGDARDPDGRAPLLLRPVEAGEAGTRLDVFLHGRLPERSRAGLKRLVAGGSVRILGVGVALDPSRKVRAGEKIAVELPPPEPTRLEAWAVSVPVLLADPDFLVVDKPAGWVVHPGAGHRGETLVNALLSAHPEIATAGSAARPGIVHRLDKGTSGALVVARTPRAYDSLVAQFSAHCVRKVYLAVVAGRPRLEEGRIDVPIGRDPVHRKRFAARPAGKPAETLYRVRSSHAGFSFLEVRIVTGRTHQIRVHLTALGNAILGDAVYGRARRRLPEALEPLVDARPGPFLHAWRLGFAHPVTGAPVDVEAPVPPDFERLWSAVLAI